MLEEEAVPRTRVVQWWIEQDPLVQTGLVLGGAAALFVLYRVFLLRHITRLAESTENDLDDRLVLFGRRFFGVVLVVGTAMAILKIHGIAVSPILAGAGIAGIALGFAAKETLADILAGIFLIADRPMRIGDRVKIEFIGRDWGGWGDVVDIGLRRTMVRNTDGVIVNYPNALLSSGVITNFSFEHGPVRVRVRFQVGYDADLDQAGEVARQAIEIVEEVLDGTVEVVVRGVWDESRGHTAAGILMEGRYRIEDVRRRTKIRSKVLIALQAALNRENVPRPGASLHVHDPGR